MVTRCLTLFFTILAGLSLNAKTSPNVIIIYGDDVGFGDVGAYGSELISTPHLDALAAEGIRFTDGHSSAATCSPSRFAMLTGTHGFRKGVGILPPNAPLSITPDTYTIADMFKAAGYTTGVIGKWHLGIGSAATKTDWNSAVKPGPLEIGFDYSFLLPSTNDRVPTVYLDGHYVVNHDPSDPIFVGRSKKEVDRPGSTAYPDGKVNPETMTYYASTHGHNHSVINGIGRIGYMSGGKAALWDDETIADVFVDKTRAFIAENKDTPFFLYFASQDIHVPRAPHPRFQGKTSLGYRGDAMVQLDWKVGAIMESLEKHGLTENTMIIFSSDNGPVYDDGYDDGTTVKTSREEIDRGHDGSGPYRGGKYQIAEGGTRVPFIVKWPAGIKPGVSDALVCQVDLMASLATLIGQDIPNGAALDSRDIFAALKGNDPIGLPFMATEATARHRGLREGDWKFNFSLPRKKNKSGQSGYSQGELYNLAEDIGEQNNVFSKYPEIAEKMRSKLIAILEAPGINHMEK
ncbi:MAG: sulfatase family protein [Opitutales bacterium]